MFPPNVILFAGLVGFVAALAAAWILYWRVYARRLDLHETSARRPPDLPEPELTSHEEELGAVRLRQQVRERERRFSEDVGPP